MMTRREILVAALLAPFLKAWRQLVPADAWSKESQIADAIGAKPVEWSYTYDPLATVTDYQALYADVLDRMHYSYYEAIDLTRQPAVETRLALNPACLRHGSSRRSRNR